MSARDAVLELKARIGRSIVGQEHILSGCAASRPPAASLRRKFAVQAAEERR